MLKLKNGYKTAYQCAYGSLFFEKNNLRKDWFWNVTKSVTH